MKAMAGPAVNSEEMSRRSLLKLMAMATPAFFAAAEELPQGKSEFLDHPTALPRPDRPRLFYNAGSLVHLRRVFSPDSAAGAALRRRGDALLQADFYPESVAEIGGGQQANYLTPATQVADMGLTLGLLFHLTGDTRYAAKLRDALIFYGNYVRWAGPELIYRLPPWHSELDTTTFSFGYSCGYDALHSFLSESERQAIAGIMVRLGVGPTLDDWLLPGKRIHSLDSMGHNWWGVCVSGAGLCALALLGDDPRASSWIETIDAGFAQWFEYPGNVLQNRVATFESSGPSYEGVGYTNYGVSEYLRYRFAWQNTFPHRKPARIARLEHLAEFFLQTLYPTSSGFLTINFGDSGLRADSSGSVLLLIACGLGTPAASRYLQLVSGTEPDTLSSLLRQFPAPAPRSDWPLSSIYPEVGWLMMRSSWQQNATLLAAKSGYTWNHAHADAGSFILFHGGEPLIIDSGTCSYGRPEYTTYYRTSQAHNVVLLDGQGQPPEDLLLGCKFSGRMHSLIEGPGLRYAYADATGPMARSFTRNYRHWIWSDDLILVVDDVRAHSAGEMEWLLHFAGESTIGEDGRIGLKNGAAEIAVKMLYPPADIRTELGLADHDPARKIPYLVFRPVGTAQARQFITAICLDPSAIPAFDFSEDPHFLRLRIRTRNAFEELIVNLRAVSTPGTECIDAGNWTTDACLVHLRRSVEEGPVDRFLIVDGSYLRQQGRSYMESLSKRNLCWSAGDTLRIFSGDPRSPLQIGSQNAPLEVWWNNQPVAAHYSASGKLVSL